jgi:enoyl-CoA hydratase/carnithine racemase
MQVEAVASSIAAKSPLAVQGTKAVLLHARDHTVMDGLDYVATRNSAQLISADIVEAIAATRDKRLPVFSRL